MPDGGAILSPLHEAARAYAAAGWAVFPCLPGQKCPATSNGFHAATTDAAQIERWWTENPVANIGFVPGSAGLCVVDVDAKEQPGGATGVANWRRLTGEHGSPDTTYRVKTPGGGWHVYFRGELPSTAGKIAPGIDTRGGGTGYVLLAPSTVGGKPYQPAAPGSFEPLPDWISQAVQTPRYRDPAAREFIDRSQKVPVSEAELAAILSHLDPDCAYDPWYIYIGAIRATRLAGVAEDQADARLLEIAQAWSRGDYWSIAPSRWEGDDSVEAKFWAMPPKPGGSTFGTLYYAARQCGYDKPPPRPSNEDIFGDPGADAPQEEQRAADQAEHVRRFRPVKPSEAMRRRPPRFYDKDKLLLHAPGGSSTVIYAQYSNFKTTFACGRALAIAKEHAVRVLYVVCEGADGFGPLTLQAAVKDWNASHPEDPVTPEWLDANFLMEEVPPRLTDPLDMAALAEAYREFAPSIAVVDTLGAAAAGLNLSAIEVGTAIGGNFRAFVRDLKCDGWLVHHEGKNEENGATGSQYIMNDADSGLNLRHDPKQEVLAVRVEKSRWGERHRTVNFGTRKIAGLRVEGWDEPAEFVAVYELASDDPKRDVKVARNKTQAKAQDDAQSERQLVEDALRDAGARDIGSSLKGIDLAYRLAGDQYDDESVGEHQKRVETWAKKLKNKAARDPLFAGLFATVTENNPPHQVRHWFAPQQPPSSQVDGAEPW